MTTTTRTSTNVPLILSREYLAGFLDGAMHIFLMNKHRGFPNLSITVRCQFGERMANALVATFGCGRVYVDASPGNNLVQSCRWRVLAVQDVHAVLRSVAADLVLQHQVATVALLIAEQFDANTELRLRIRENGPQESIELERELRAGVLRIYELEHQLEAAKHGDGSIETDVTARHLTTLRYVSSPRLVVGSQHQE